MPKKRNPKFPKPTPDPHSCFKRLTHNPATATNAGDSSVNLILAKLRSEAPGPAKPPSATRSVPPALQEIFENVVPPPPPPRREMGIALRGRSRVPGPPPPASWLSDGPDPGSEMEAEAEDSSSGLERHELTHLPGTPAVDRRRLLHYALKAMAMRWDEHVVYDQHWLEHLPSNVKTLLLSYIAAFAPTGATLVGLRVLFRSPDTDVTALDLSRSLTSELTLPQLAHFLRPNRMPTELASSWEDDDAKYPTLFPNLTHLSISHPRSPVPFANLLAFARSVPTITHLSMAGWSTGGMKRLARNLLCLKWLDVSNCHHSVYEELKDVEWSGPWRNVETVVAKQDAGLPICVRVMRNNRTMELRRVIRETRRERGGKWCIVIGGVDAEVEVKDTVG